MMHSESGRERETDREREREREKDGVGWKTRMNGAERVKDE